MACHLNYSRLDSSVRRVIDSKRFRFSLIVPLLLALVADPSGSAQAQQVEDTHTVTAEVKSISAVAVAAPPPLVARPESRRTVTSTYSVVTNRPVAQSIVVSVEGTPPEGIALYVRLEAPEDAQRTEDTPLQVLRPDGQVTPQPLVTGIGQVSTTGLEVSVQADVSVAADPGDASVRLSLELVE